MRTNDAIFQTNDNELANRVRLMKNFGFIGSDNVAISAVRLEDVKAICRIIRLALENANTLMQHIGRLKN